MSDTLRQIEVENLHSGEKLVTWVSCDPKLKVDYIIEFADLDDLWRVTQVYTNTIKQHSIHRKWPVGGL